MNKGQGHGDHIGAIIDTKTFIGNHLRPLIGESKVEHKCREKAFCEGVNGSETDIYVLATQTKDVVWQTLLGATGEGKPHSFVTCYPVLEGNTIIKAKITDVEPWGNLIEATVTCEIAGETEVSFFATDYVWNKSQYVIGKELYISLAALAYAAEEASRGFSFEGQKAIDWLAKIGKKPDYDEYGRVKPVKFDTSNLVAFLQRNKDYPEDYEFQSPLEGASEITTIGENLLQSNILIKRDPDLKISFYCKSSMLPNATDKTPVRGLLWMQGHISKFQPKPLPAFDNSFGEVAMKLSDLIKKKDEEGVFKCCDDVNWLLEPLDLISIPDGYVVDVFKVGDRHGSTMRLYICEADAQERYIPRKEEVQVALPWTKEDMIRGKRRYEKRIQYVRYDDTQYIQGMLSDDEAEAIPEIWDYLSLPFTPMGVWQAFLLKEILHLLPIEWHAAYSAIDYIYHPKSVASLLKAYKDELSAEGIEKMKRYSSSWELCPRVTIDHGIATIKCAYWSEYGGLYSATITVAKKGRTVEFLERESENLVKYESSIIY